MSGLLGVELGQVQVLELLQVLGRQAAAEVGWRAGGAVGVLVVLGRRAGPGAELLGALALGGLEHAHLGLELGERVVLVGAAALLELEELGLEGVAR